VKAAKARDEGAAFDSQSTIGVRRFAPHRRCQTRAITASRFGAVEFAAPAQYGGKIGLGGLGKPTPSHLTSIRGRNGEFVQVSVEFIVRDLSKRSAIERGNALLDGDAQLFESQAFQLAPAP
jgi:hypothetical protein